MYIAGGLASASLDPSLASSTDGITWTARTSTFGATSGIYSSTYGANLYVIGGRSGALATSADGTSWTARTSNTTQTINRMAFGNSTFVLIANTDVRTSTDGITWTTRTSLSSSVDGLKYLGNTFIGYSNNNYILSTNGVTWTTFTMPGTSVGLNYMLYDGTKYMAWGTNSATTTKFAVALDKEASLTISNVSSKVLAS